MGEQFTLAISSRGYVYTWGMNDRGQLGVGHETPLFEPAQIPFIGPTAKHTIKSATKIACGLKHCLILTKNCQLYSWGSNLQCQLGKKLAVIQGNNGSVAAGVQAHSNVPVHIAAYDQAVPLEIACGSYHNIVLSHALPKQEQPNFDNQILTKYGLGDDQTANN